MKCCIDATAESVRLWGVVELRRCALHWGTQQKRFSDSSCYKKGIPVRCNHYDYTHLGVPHYDISTKSVISIDCNSKLLHVRCQKDICIEHNFNIVLFNINSPPLASRSWPEQVEGTRSVLPSNYWCIASFSFFLSFFNFRKLGVRSPFFFFFFLSFDMESSVYEVSFVGEPCWRRHFHSTHGCNKKLTRQP